VWWMIKARSHAMMAQREQCFAALGNAEDQLSKEATAQDVELISYFGAGDLADERAHCFFSLDDFDRAREEAAKALSLFDSDRVRRKVIDGSLHAAGLVRTGDLEQAAATAHEVLGAGVSLRSFRASQSVARMMAELLPHRQVGVVEDVFDFARSVVPVTPSVPNGNG
jgi:hypothetical protein